jgi:hypothetical protein
MAGSDRFRTHAHFGGEVIALQARPKAASSISTGKPSLSGFFALVASLVVGHVCCAHLHLIWNKAPARSRSNPQTLPGPGRRR